MAGTGSRDLLTPLESRAIADFIKGTKDMNEGVILNNIINILVEKVNSLSNTATELSVKFGKVDIPVGVIKEPDITYKGILQEISEIDLVLTMLRSLLGTNFHASLEDAILAEAGEASRKVTTTDIEVNVWKDNTADSGELGTRTPRTNSSGLVYVKALSKVRFGKEDKLCQWYCPVNCKLLGFIDRMGKPYPICERNMELLRVSEDGYERTVSCINLVPDIDNPNEDMIPMGSKK